MYVLKRLLFEIKDLYLCSYSSLSSRPLARDQGYIYLYSGKAHVGLAARFYHVLPYHIQIHANSYFRACGILFAI